MSQQDNSQENQAVPPEGNPGTWSTEPASNRPADGATRVASLHQAEQTWRAGEGATDFLGLEQDTAVEAPPASAASEAVAPGASPEVSPTQAWLFHMENEAQATAPTAAQLAASASPEWSAESLLDGQDTSTPLAGEPAAAGLPALPLATELATEEAPADEVQPEAPRRSRKVQWLVAAGLLAALAGAGGWQIWHGKTKGGSSSSADPLAWRSGGKPSAKPAPKPTPVAPTVAKQPPPVHPKPDPKPEVAVVETHPADPAPPTPEPVAQPAPEPVAVAPSVPEPSPTEPEPATAPAPTDFTPVPFSGTRPTDLTADIATPKGARRPDAAEVANLWIDAAIPFDAIAGEQMMRTPRVGAVRLLLKNGEHLQGRLHAVGQGQVSVDIALGRMSVDYSDVSEIVQILEADLTKKPSNGLPEETAGLLYISAKVPGGQLAGWLVQRADGKLTLITEEAKKITIDDDGFEPISKGRARVVGTIGRDSTAEAPPLPAPDTRAPKLKSGSDAGKAPAKPAAQKPLQKPAQKQANKPKG